MQESKDDRTLAQLLREHCFDNEQHSQSGEIEDRLSNGIDGSPYLLRGVFSALHKFPTLNGTVRKSPGGSHQRKDKRNRSEGCLLCCTATPGKAPEIDTAGQSESWKQNPDR